MENRVKARLGRGQPVFGVYVTQPSVAIVQLLANGGLDWLMFDMEHGLIDTPSLQAMIAAAANAACVPLVRTPLDERGLVEHALDAGALGLVFPTVSTRAQAEAAVRAMHYPPRGERGWGPFYAAAQWRLSPVEYYEAAGRELLKVVLIEQHRALDELDDILAVPGIDVAAIAPGDLAAGLGHPGDRHHPEVLEVVAEIERRVLASGVALGGVALAPGEANAKVAAGYRFLFMGADASLLQRALADALDGVTRELP